MNPDAELVSLFVGMPKLIEARQPWTTAFFKTPVEGFCWLGSTNLDGDRQADRSVHGGPDKAVCVYPASHYDLWSRELHRGVGGPGWFGENFTVSNQTETSVCVGDVYRVGTTIVQVSQPRGPCWKLALRWRQPDLPKRVIATGRSGWYLRVLKEGSVSPNCPIALQSRPWPQWTIARVNELTYTQDRDESLAAQRIALADCSDLADAWRAMLVGD